MIHKPMPKSDPNTFHVTSLETGKVVAITLDSRESSRSFLHLYMDTKDPDKIINLILWCMCPN